jgi:hypothetical protein
MTQALYVHMNNKIKKKKKKVCENWKKKKEHLDLLEMECVGFQEGIAPPWIFKKWRSTCQEVLEIIPTFDRKLELLNPFQQ